MHEPLETNGPVAVTYAIAAVAVASMFLFVPYGIDMNAPGVHSGVAIVWVILFVAIEFSRTYHYFSYSISTNVLTVRDRLAMLPIQALSLVFYSLSIALSEALPFLRAMVFVAYAASAFAASTFVCCFLWYRGESRTNVMSLPAA